MNIGENIRRIREQNGLSKAELARRVGVSGSMICQVERGTKACSMQLGAQIASALGCEVSELYGESRN